MKTQLFHIATNWDCVQVQGPDSRAFLQRMTSANFKLLKTSCQGALLNANGKMLSYFHAYSLDENSFLLFAPGNTGQTLADNLEKFHFAENLNIGLGSDYGYGRILTEPTSTFNHPGIRFSEFQTRTHFQFDTARQFDSRFFYFKKTDESQVLTALEGSGLSEVQDFEPYRIALGEASFPNEISENTIPLEAGLDEAVHENKGCYPGQEVVERIRSMGAAPRKLFAFRSDGTPPDANTPVSNPDGIDIGVLTSVARLPDTDSWVALGFIKKMYVNTPEMIVRSNKTRHCAV